MTELAAKWKTAKDKALKSGKLPPEMVMELSQGYDFGPALKTFDKSDTFEKRQKAIVPVLKAKTGYEKAIKQILKSIKDSNQKAVLTGLTKAIEEIWTLAEKEIQPLRPSGNMVQYEVLREFNLSAGLKLKYLDVKSTTVTCVVEMDKLFETLVKEGKESLKVQHLGEVAKAELEKHRSAFKQTMEDIEAKIQKKPEIAAAKSKEANEVLKHYAKIVEDRVNAAVRVEWEGYLARRKHLADFKFKSNVKIVLGVVGIGVAAASIGLSFGAAWINIIAVCKGVAELVQNIKTRTQDIDKTHSLLKNDIAKIEDLVKQREKARTSGAGQKASKGKEAAKELANALLPLTKLILRSAGTFEDNAKQLLGQVSKIEDEADTAVGALNKVLKQIDTIPEREMTPAQKKAAKELSVQIEKFFKEIADMHKQAQDYGKFGDRCLQSVTRLRSNDEWSAGTAMKGGNYSVRGVAAYSAVNFVYQAAMAGKSLIPI